MIFSRIIIKYGLFYAYTLMLSNFALHGYSFGGSAHGVVPAFFYRCPGRPRVGWRRYELAPETSSLETVSSSGESTNHRFHDSPSLQPTCVRGGLPCSRVARRAPTVEQIGLWRNRSGSLPSSSSGTTS